MKNVTVVALRISAVFLLLQSLKKAAATLPYWEQLSGQVDTSIAAVLAMILLPAIIAFVFWFYAPAVANLILATPFDDKIEISWPISIFESMAFSVVGAITLTWAVPDAFYWLAVMIQGANVGAEISSINRFVPEIATTVVELIIGFWLLFGAKGLGDFLAKVKAAGRSSNHEIKADEN